MQRYDTVFRQVSKSLDWQAFEAIVAEHNGDHRVRRLRCRDQLGAMLFAQLSGARSLREVEAGMRGQAARLYHCAFRPAARSTLSDANSGRSADIFAAFFAHMAAGAARGLRRHLKPLRILDATRIGLPSRCRDWALGPKGAVSAKLHLVYDPDAQAPLAAQISGPRVNDITPAKAAEITSGATYVFDLGYYSFDWWARLSAQGCRFVTRLKRHTQLQDRRDLPAPSDPDLLAERIGRLPHTHARDLQTPLREIEVALETGKTLRLVTNDLDSPAREIADLYRARWQVELAFRWIKQNLRLTRFLGTTWNAVRTQIYTALIAWLLVRMTAVAHGVTLRTTTFLNLVTQNLMHRRPIDSLDTPRPPPPSDPRQTEMVLP